MLPKEFDKLDRWMAKIRRRTMELGVDWELRERSALTRLRTFKALVLFSPTSMKVAGNTYSHQLAHWAAYRSTSSRSP